MNKDHRRRLDLHCDEVVQRINFDALWPKLLENGIYNRDDVNIPIWTSPVTITTVRDVFLTIKTRGPRAFENLLKSFRESGHEDLADLLAEQKEPSVKAKVFNYKKDVENNISNMTKPFMDLKDEYFERMQSCDEPLEIKVRPALTFLDCPSLIETVERYPMRSNPRGFVLIIANIQYINERSRAGAEHDEKNLEELFKQMGFEVTTLCNLTGKQIKDAIREFSCQKDFHKVHSCFVVITSHGDQVADDSLETEIQGVDFNSPRYQPVLCTEILDFFTVERCRALAGKPKVFIFQACRGQRIQKAIPRNVTDTCVKTDSIGKIDLNVQTTRNYSDILVAHSTMPGFAANRDIKTGSWFIQILCDVFMNYACTTHLQDLFNMIDSRIECIRTEDNSCQTLTVTSMGFSKHCYLNPGLFEEDR
ncbi:caspase-2 isoform X2 [Orussus abietinus]|uniref:caspase-2 isoform X2 n=1 Tax=Orussus abietinus TaxID=222816 RepID=UPI000C715D68|nr:caspase-2 isoform X2 [Orussus abietinus]